MKRYTSFRLIMSVSLLLVVSITIFGKSENKVFWDRIHIRHNLNIKENVAQPAFFQLTIPDEGKTVLSTGIGIMLDVIPENTLMELGLFAEYQKNTMIDKEQDVLKAGAVMEWQLFPAKSGRFHSPILLPKFNYKNDVIKNTKSIQASLSLTHIFAGSNIKGFPLPNKRRKLLKSFYLIYSPYLGIEYENVINADVESKKGKALRGYYQIEVEIVHLTEQDIKDKIKEDLELKFGYTYKRDFNNTITGENKSYRLFIVGLNVYFINDKKKQIGVGLRYVNGEDPGIGLEKQKFIEFGLRFKFD